jgi:hypothetical protein
VAEGQVLNIPEAGFSWFKDKMETLAKRAKKLTGERLFLTVVGFHKEEDTGSKFYGKKIMEVFVAFPEPKLAGWEFVARIDHASEAGNIVRTTGLRALPQFYRDAGPECDHCGHNRKRRDTFVVHHDEQGFKQVGTSCLKDFLGHGDAAKWAKIAELNASIGEFVRGTYDHSEGLINRAWISTQSFMERCAVNILANGFTSKKASYETGKQSTAEDVWAGIHGMHLITPQAAQLAQDALEWAQNLTGDISDYEHNCYVIANSESIEPRSIGIAASIVGVYYRNQQPKGQGSVHMGVVGAKLEVLVMVDEVRTLENSFMHKLRDRQGNQYTWFASKPALRDSLGKPVRIRSTVKKHDEFKGHKSTILTRVKAV